MCWEVGIQRKVRPSINNNCGATIYVVSYILVQDAIFFLYRNEQQKERRPLPPWIGSINFALSHYAILVL